MIRYYKNKKTQKVCFIIKEEKNLVRVQYVTSQFRSWYEKEFFAAHFEKVI